MLLLKVFFIYKITADVHLGLPSLWFVRAVFETWYWVPAHCHFIFATVVYKHKWSLFFCMCTPKYIMLTLQESVPTSTGKFQWFLGSSLVSMSMEPVSKTHNSWLSTLLMFCCFERRGIVSLPFSSVMPWRHVSLFLLNEGILGGPWCSPPPLYPHFSNVWASLRANC